MGGPRRYSSSLITLKESTLDLHYGANFNSYRYGVSRDTPAKTLILKAGADISRLIFVDTAESAIHMLVRKRFDGWVNNSISAFWAIRSLGYEAQDFKIIYTFERSYFYFAFNKETPDHVINPIQTTLDDIKRDGTLDKIIEKYMGSQSDFILSLTKF